MSFHWTHRKRRAKVAPAEPEIDTSALDPVEQELLELRAWRDELFRPVRSQGTFDLLVAGSRSALARQLWTGGYLESMAVLREDN